MIINSIKKQFMHSLKRGTGEAYLIIKNNPNIDFSNQIIRGVLNNYAYDAQSEGNRAKYIFDIILATKQHDKIRKVIVNGLTERTDTWNLAHLFALAKLFAEQGDGEMKESIYKNFCSNPIPSSEWMGEEEILELDGFQGLVYIAEKLGKHIAHTPNYWQDDFLINSFQEKNPEIKVMETLKEVATTNQYINLYLNSIQQHKAKQAQHKIKSIEYKDIVEEVLSRKFLFFKQTRTISDSEVVKVAEKLMQESNKTNIEKLLRFFYYYQFPFEPEFILDLAKQKRNSKYRIVENAIDALKHLQSPSIREFAIENIKNSKYSMDYLIILVSNYQDGDYLLLNQIINKAKNEHKIERLAGIYNDIYTQNKTTECKEPLEHLYSKMNCGIHRNGLVKILIANNVLSNKIKDEIRFDSYLKTRELVM